MPLKHEQKIVQPKQEDKTYKIEVVLNYYDSTAHPFVFAHVEGDGADVYISKDAVLTERYVFEVTSPLFNKMKLNGGKEQGE